MNEGGGWIQRKIAHFEAGVSERTLARLIDSGSVRVIRLADRTVHCWGADLALIRKSRELPATPPWQPVAVDGSPDNSQTGPTAA